MQDGFRQRLVGALVLVCLSLIVWPLIFYSDGLHSVDRVSQIPGAPNFKKFTVDKPSKPVNMPSDKRYSADDLPLNEPVSVASIGSADQKSHAVAKPVNTKNPTVKAKLATKSSPKPSLTNDGLPVYWALQVASLSQKSKADALKKSLIDKGYKVDMRAANTGAGKVIRVYIGPKLDKRSLSKIQTKVNQQFNVKSILVRFTPK